MRRSVKCHNVMYKTYLIIFVCYFCFYGYNTQGIRSNVWKWECDDDAITNETRLPRCKKVMAEEASNKATELNKCKLTCGNASMLFPKPSGRTVLGKTTVPFYPTRMTLSKSTCGGKSCSYMVQWLLQNAFSSFQDTMVKSYHIEQNPNARMSANCRMEAMKRKIDVQVFLQNNGEKLTLATDESYELSIKTTSSVIQVEIRANNFFGARHGLETVSQLSAYHSTYDSMQIVSSVDITDAPAYPYRGLLLDTSRNYFSVDNIKRLISAMSYSKMNTLHWHITDTHSFPIEIKSEPRLQEYGAYSPGKVYSHSDVQKIVSHASFHGIRVLPEFDEPAHCGEGWQWGQKAGLGKLAVCVNKEPWQKYCVEPPCGQLNPINDNVYDILGKIYKEYMMMFKPDIFHAGGDEINLNCWNTTQEIVDWLEKSYGSQSADDIMKMWGMFLDRSSNKIYEANGNKKLPLILWTSKMTDKKYLTKYMDPKKHIVQLWTGSTDKHIADIVNSGFKTIFSTYDTLYLDCGYGNWLVKGNNWCSPYKDWKLLYDNDPVKILNSFKITVTPQIRSSILGQEAAMWSEQVDQHSSEGKIWPRTAALAERLWTNPDHDWRDAEYRLIYHRERLVNRGIQADALQPLWCEQNAGHCYYDPSIKGMH